MAAMSDRERETSVTAAKIAAVTAAARERIATRMPCAHARAERWSLELPLAHRGVATGS
jgi:hypothetical protein